MTDRAPIPPPPYCIAGLGRAGEAAARLLLRRTSPEQISIWDGAAGPRHRGAARRWRRRGVAVTLSGDPAAWIAAAPKGATLIKSPGIDMDAPVTAAAIRCGLPVLDELALGWRAWSGPLIAVTGTNGKSTSCAAIAAVLTAAGRPAQIVGNTEFGPPMSGAAPDQTVVCETSSFQLEATSGVVPDVAVFTNLSLEHLPRHHDMERYGATKQKLFVQDGRVCGVAICNIDDPWGRRIMAAAQAAGARGISYGFAPDATVRIRALDWDMRGADLDLCVDGAALSVRTAAPGRANASNLAAAAAVGVALGLPLAAIGAGLAQVTPPPGRWRFIDAGQSFDVVVDYAHTPDGLAQTLLALRHVAAKRGTALRVVFGAVGLPDGPKARGCAEAIAAGCDVFYLTTGSAPRSHRILRMAEIKRAAQPIRPATPVLDRRQALARALREAAPGDVVAALGLGALTRMVVDGRGSLIDHSDGPVLAALLRGGRL